MLKGLSYSNVMCAWTVEDVDPYNIRTQKYKIRIKNLKSPLLCVLYVINFMIENYVFARCRYEGI